jgi:hypothetical protein
MLCKFVTDFYDGNVDNGSCYFMAISDCIQIVWFYEQHYHVFAMHVHIPSHAYNMHVPLRTGKELTALLPPLSCQSAVEL